MKPLVLHTMDVNWRPNPLKVAILLERLKIPYEVKKWTSGSDATGVEGPAFTKTNPYGRTPAVEDGNTGVLVWESGVVLDYIVRTYDRENLTGPAPKEETRVAFDEWNQVLLTGLAPALGELAFFRSIEQKEATVYFESQVHRILAVVELQLEKSTKFLMGDKFTVVDINFYPWLNLHDAVGLNIQSYPNLSRWLSECKRVPEIAAALQNSEEGSSGQEVQ
jgi:glutathione S-transferase